MSQSEPVMSIGDKIAFVRKAAGLSQEAFARQIGIGRSAYQHYERNEHDVPSSVLTTLCKQFGIDPTWLLFDDGEKLISERGRGSLEISRYLCDFVEGRARRLGKTLTEQKKWEIIHIIADDFFEADGDLEQISSKCEETTDNLIRLVAA